MVFRFKAISGCRHPGDAYHKSARHLRSSTILLMDFINSCRRHRHLVFS